MHDMAVWNNTDIGDQEIETWVEALTYYDNNEFENSLRVFDNIADTSKILFNCGVIHATIGEHDRAVGGLTCGKYLADLL